MRVLVCSSALTSQADAPYSTRMRALGMREAGLDVEVIGFPETYPGGQEQGPVRYRSVWKAAPSARRERWARRRQRYGNYWKFILEPALVEQAAYALAGRERFDVVYITHGEPSRTLLLWPWLRLRGMCRPTAITYPGSFYQHAQMKDRPLASRMRGRLNRLAARCLPRWMHVVCNDRYLTSDLGIGNHPNVHIIPEGYQVRRVSMSQDEARDALGLPRGPRMLLLFGVASHAKGSDILLQSLDGLSPSFLVCIVGPTGGVYEPSWGATDALYRQGWKEHLRVVGRYVSDEEMERYFVACDAVVIPYRRGFIGACTNLRLASEYGKAILASDQYQMGEMVREYQLGLVFPPEDASALRDRLIEFAGRPQSWFDDIGRRSETVVARYAWARVGEMYRDLFRKLAEPERAG